MRDLYLQMVRLDSSPPADSYLSRLPVVRHLARTPLVFHAPVTLLVGENGVGKSTLIEAIAVGMGFNAEGGTRNFNFSTHATHSPILMTYPGAEVLEITSDGIRPVDYRETAHYQLTRRFLESPEAMYRTLFS